MNDIIKMTIDSYMTVFDSYEVKDDSINKSIFELKEDFAKLGESISDPGEFSSKLMNSDIYKRYSELINTVATQGYADVQKSENTQKIPTVKEYLEQYRSSYDEVKKSGKRKRAQKAYENIFDVANRTDNMLEAQIILEQERLLWKIVPEDMIDNYENILSDMDPLSKNLILPIKMHLDVWRKLDSDEEATYEIDIMEKEKNILLERENFIMTLPIILADLLISYNSSKIEFRMWGSGGSLAKSGLMKLIVLRENIRNTYNLFVEKFDYSFDRTLSEEWLKLWMLIPSNLDEKGKYKMSLDPYNLEVYKYLLFEEILSDKPIEEILTQEQEKLFRYALHKRSDEVAKNYTEIIKNKK